MKRDCACPRARHEHGSVGAYHRDRCRCLPCRLAKSYALASYRAGDTWHEQDDNYVAKIGTVRRLQGLMAIGYTSREMAAAAGLSEHHVQNLRTAGHQKVSLRIALAVARAYDELWDKPPTGPQAARQRTKARRMGYKVPLEWDDDAIDKTEVRSSEEFSHIDERHYMADPIDEIAVAEAIHGRRVHLTFAEMTEAIARLTRMGRSAEQIAEVLGTSTRTVVRKRRAA